MEDTEDNERKGDEGEELDEECVQNDAGGKLSRHGMHTKSISLESLEFCRNPKEFCKNINSMMKNNSIKFQTLESEITKNKEQIQILQNVNQKVHDKMKILQCDYNDAKVMLKCEQEEKKKITHQLKHVYNEYETLSTKLGLIEASQGEINDKYIMQLKQLEKKCGAVEDLKARLEKACIEITARQKEQKNEQVKQLQLHSKLEAQMEANQLQTHEKREVKLKQLKSQLKTIESSQKKLEDALVVLKCEKNEQTKQLESIDENIEGNKLMIKELLSKQNADQTFVNQIESKCKPVGTAQIKQLEYTENITFTMKEIQSQQNAEQEKINQIKSKCEAVETAQNKKQECIDESIETIKCTVDEIQSKQNTEQEKIKQMECKGEAVRTAQKKELECIEKNIKTIKLTLEEIQSKQNADQGKIKQMECKGEAVRTAQKKQLECIEKNIETITITIEEMQSKQNADQGKIEQIESKSESLGTAQKRQLEGIGENIETIKVTLEEIQSKQNADQEKIKQIESNCEAVGTAQKQRLECIGENIETIKLMIEKVKLKQNADQGKIEQIETKWEAMDTAQKKQLESIDENIKSIKFTTKEIQSQHNTDQGKIKQIESKCEGVETAQKRQCESTDENFKTIERMMKEVQSRQSAEEGKIKQIESKYQAVQTAQAWIQHKVANLEKSNVKVHQVPENRDMKRRASAPGLQGIQGVWSKQNTICVMCKKDSFLDAAEKCIGSVAKTWKPSPSIISKKVGAVHVPIGYFQDAEFVVLVAVPEPRGIVLSNNEPCQLGGAYKTATDNHKKIMVIMCVQGNNILAPADVLHSSCSQMLESQPLLKKLYKQGQLMSVVYEEYGQKPMKLNVAQEIMLKIWAYGDIESKHKEILDTTSNKSFRGYPVMSVSNPSDDLTKHF